MNPLLLLPFLPLLCMPAPAEPQPKDTEFSRQQDVVYGRKYGTALTMDVFEPKGKWNGASVIWVVSGGWYSDHASINLDRREVPVKQLLKRGYKVYAVVHGSNPLFTAEDAVADIQLAVRNIRHRAIEAGYTTMPIGIIGASAGGHLSLMAGMAGDDGDKKSKDPVQRRPSRVQAVACYFPPTDFLNYGETHVNTLDTTVGKYFAAPFKFKRLNPQTRTLDLVTSRGLINNILAEISPITHVTKDDAPTMIIQGDQDQLVPMQQAEIFIEKLSAAGVDTELIKRPGAGHGWATIPNDNELMIDWFDKHLLNVDSDEPQKTAVR